MMTASGLAIPDPAIHFAIGAVAGGTGAVAAYPMDYIKSQMQTEHGQTTYSSGWDCFRTTTLRRPLDLYKGVGVQVLGIAPEKGIKLGVNDVLLGVVLVPWFPQPLDGTGSMLPPLWALILSGGMAGACQVLASSPLEVLKVGLQTSDMTLAQVWKQIGGPRGLFRGAPACILRDVLFTAICFPLYAIWVQQYGMPAFVAGATSGLIASWAVTPPDVIKTRILSQDDWTRQQQQQQQDTSLLRDTTITNATSQIGLDGSVALAMMNTTMTTSTTSALRPPRQPDYNQILPPPPSSSSINPFVVGQAIVQREGADVLWSGVTERCLGAIPRFGTTLAMHDVMEQWVTQAGWLSHHPPSL